jgi:anti-sigma factor RsiW
MNHPTREDLVTHLYGELPPAQQAQIAAHLDACADCRQLTTDWRSTMAELDAWQLPARPPRVEPAPQNVVVAPFLRWAVAACLALGCGFLGGRLSAPAPDTAAVRAEFAADLRQLAVTLETQRAEDRRALTELLQAMQGQRAEDYATLRRELETLAVNTEDGLSTVVQLAAATEPNPR